jgi:hypothetical protein
MKQFTYYEFTSILVPGGIFTAGILALFPGTSVALSSSGISFGEFGLLILVAYGLGHLIQAVGNGVEWAWWTLWGGGMPSDWIRSGKHILLGEPQRNAVFLKVQESLGIALPDPVSEMSKRDWHAVVRQIYAEVQECKAAERLDAFTGNYGINRGLAATFVALTAISFLAEVGDEWRLYVGYGIFTALALVRMHRFGVHYARELFVQFLAANTTGGKR